MDVFHVEYTNKLLHGMEVHFI